MHIKTIGIAAVLVVMAAPAVAQRGPRGGAPPRLGGAMRGDRIESALRMREDLALTEDQIAQLDALRRARVAERQAAWGAMAELQSQLRAGLISREEFRDATQSRRDSVRAAAGDPLSEILTEDQVSQLGRDTRRHADGMRGRRGSDGRPRRFRRN